MGKVDNNKHIVNSSDGKSGRSGLNVMLRLIGLVKPLAGYMAVAILMGLAGHLCASFITIFGGYAILDVSGYDTGLTLGVIFVCVIVFALVRAGFRYAEQSCNHFIAFKLLAIIRDKVFRALRKLCPARLEGRDRGDLISIITSDIELLEVFYAHTISPIAIAVLYTIIMCCYIGSFHWSLALIALIAYICVGVAIPLIASKASGDDGLRYRTKSGELSSFVLESLRGASETIQYGNGAKRLELMNGRTDDLSEDARRMKNVSGVNTAVTNVCILVFDIIMLLAGVKLYYAGIIGFDGVLLTTIALFSSFGPAVALAALGSTLQSTFAAGNRVLDILDEEPVIEELTGNKEIEFEGINAEDVTFAYGEETILDNFSIDIKKGEITGIIGKSGSGKSTLAKLLNAINLPDEGTVLINGMDTRDEQNLYDIRRTVGMVFQNPDNQIVATVVEEDVAFALENIGVEPKEIRRRVDEALKTVGMYEYREHAPHKLSGGQKQRVAIAGVLAMKPDCIVLDEPTAMLDPIGRREIMMTIKELNEMGVTIVLITHYMDEAAQAKRVVVIDNGRIVMDDKPKKVFSQVETLCALGLDVPQVTELTHELIKEGVNLPPDIIDENECYEALLKLLS